jgi:hypothetical protein
VSRALRDPSRVASFDSVPVELENKIRDGGGDDGDDDPRRLTPEVAGLAKICDGVASEATYGRRQ